GALITVEDGGPGVSAELRKAIFEPFRQGEQVVQHSPGVGIGLSLVARFAALHNGRAWVDDRPGGGASFKVYLPRETPVRAVAGCTFLPPPTTSAAARAGTPRRPRRCDPGHRACGRS